MIIFSIFHRFTKSTDQIDQTREDAFRFAALAVERRASAFGGRRFPDVAPVPGRASRSGQPIALRLEDRNVPPGGTAP